jgi:Lon protease-like protein
VQRGRAAPELGDYGTCARIVDWDQLPNGLLGITIAGGERFELFETQTRSNGLIVGQVALQEAVTPVPMSDTWLSLLNVLRSLETHPHVERMKLRVDYNDAWQVAYTLIQLLPLDEALKYELLGVDSIHMLMAKLQGLLNKLSGED